MSDWKDLLNQLHIALHEQKFEQAKLLRCANCKITLEEVLKVGRLGCPECYDIFGSTLSQLVEQMRSKHVGKRPKGKMIQMLEQEMVTAALDGRFEDAERFQDAIKKLKDI